MPTEVSEDVMRRSIRFARDHIYPMARRSYSGSGGSPAEKSAQFLVRKLVEHGIKRFTARDIYRKNQTGLERAWQVYPALELLEEASIVGAARQKSGGKDKVLYHLNPHIAGKKDFRGARP